MIDKDGADRPTRVDRAFPDTGPGQPARPKVAFYHATLPRSAGRKGGVEAAVHRLANALVARGNVDLTVFSSGEPPADALYTHRRVLDRSNRSQLTRLFLSPVLLNRVSFGDADVVHLHGDDWFFLARGRASVRTMYGSAWHEARTATKLKRKLSQAAVFLLEKVAVRLATVNVSIGRETRDLYGADHIVGMSVDRDIYRPAAKADAPTILFVGGWGERKRGAFMYQTFVDHVLPANPAARLLMITDHCPDHPAVTWLRDQSDADLAAAMARAWVFGYPSVYEGFGIAYIEAMACGTAIVTTDNAGARDVLEDGRYGDIVGDADFGPALVRMLADAPRRTAFERDGIAHVDKYAIDSIAAANEAIYREAVDKWRS
jgi:glycosyltransferase involved in cell wall biosynthesis